MEWRQQPGGRHARCLLVSPVTRDRSLPLPAATGIIILACWMKRLESQRQKANCSSQLWLHERFQWKDETVFLSHCPYQVQYYPDVLLTWRLPNPCLCLLFPFCHCPVLGNSYHQRFIFFFFLPFSLKYSNI